MINDFCTGDDFLVVWIRMMCNYLRCMYVCWYVSYVLTFKFTPNRRVLMLVIIRLYGYIYLRYMLTLISSIHEHVYVHPRKESYLDDYIIGIG
ncbi:hypothetical protein BDY19DRAFT_978732 [Irpex rosettiformis]|uniref:Uncharacterized protein n=1 Tax=Irpex rosettiformis TaxID=378272 RepID=A0ACB8TMZ1_9APHY|nr:hypothetical protein BDY19DRAFT_978732 [Irpex rosettiformis]